MLELGIQPHFETLNQLVIDLTMNKFYNEALLPYELLQKNNYFATDACHQAYIKSLAELGHVEKVVTLARQWIEKKYVPLMTSAVRALVVCKLPDQAWKLVKNNLGKEKSYTHMIESILDGYTNDLHQVEEAAAIWKQTRDIVPTSSIMLHTLMRGYAIKANQEQVTELVHELNRQRFQPSLDTFVSLVMCHSALKEQNQRTSIQHLALATLSSVVNYKRT